MSVRRGVWVFVMLFAALGVAIMVAALVVRGVRPRSDAPVVLVFDAPDDLYETSPASLPLSLRFARHDGPTLHEVVAAIDHAAGDPQVKALHLRVHDVNWGWAKIAEVRDAIRRFGGGKPVLASVSGGGDAEYFLATAAATITAPPSAVFQIDGLAMSAIFFRGLFDKLDIRPNFARSGRFKSGIEPYMQTGMSGPAREALESILDDQYAVYLDSLSAARGFDREEMGRLVDDGPYDAEAARAVGLVDTLLYETEADSLLGDDLGAIERVALEDYAARIRRHGGPKVALVVASGTIVPGHSRILPDGEEGLGVETLIEALQDVRDRDDIRAMVLRIDSPGGAYQPADALWREVALTRARMPVVVSMSDLAASGGYLIAAPATRIVAQPGTITGSIGIYGGKFNVAGLYRKVGLEIESLQRGERAGMMSPFRDFTPEEAERFQAQLDRDYRALVAQVAEGRGLAVETIDSLGQGRVWSGQAACAVGLVDSLGGIDTAFRLALHEADLAEDRPYAVEVYPRSRRTWLERVLAEWLDEAYARTPETPWSRLAALAASVFPPGMPLALLPYEIDVR